MNIIKMSILQAAHAICLKSPNFSKVDEEITFENAPEEPMFCMTSIYDLAEWNENHKPGEKIEYEVFVAGKLNIPEQQGKLCRMCINTGDVQCFDTLEEFMSDVMA